MRQGPDRISEVRSAGVLEVARTFGVEVRDPKLQSGGNFACPACGAEKRHTKRHDPRGAVGVRRDGRGWRCHQCDAHGDAFSLAGWLVLRKPDLKGEAGVTVLRACAERGLCSPFDDGKKTTTVQQPRVTPPPPVPPRGFPPGDEVAALWTATLPVDRTIVDPHKLDMAVAFELARRGWYPSALAALDLVRVTPLPDAYDWPRWWPRWWPRDYRVVMRAYDFEGVVRSLHARSIIPDADVKTRWPLGHPSRELLFANMNGVEMLRRKFIPGRVLIVEGMADTIAMALACADDAPNWAVLGVTTGSPDALKHVAWPKGVPVVLMPHGDDAGQKIANDARAAIPRGVDLRHGELNSLVADEDRHVQAD